MTAKTTARKRTPKPASAGSRQLNSIFMRYLRDEVFARVLSEEAQRTPIKFVLQLLKCSRQHFYMVARGDMPASKKLLDRMSVAFKTKKSALAEVLAKTQKARARAQARETTEALLA